MNKLNRRIQFNIKQHSNIIGNFCRKIQNLNTYRNTYKLTTIRVQSKKK